MNAIEVENVSKKYMLHREKPTLLKDIFLRPVKRHNTTEDFWALKDISFGVKKGEAVGIIGDNGAGKSTLLKLLTGVTKPTSGTIKVEGRVGALLELGAGFHPDLTGRENVYLNGSVLGLSKKVIDKKFNEIVDFSGLEEFIDTPVRTYSSGMFVRLGFAVAVNMEPDVLLIDEVLAVGDNAFQRRCINKIYDFKIKGKTIGLVTHDLTLMRNICDRVYWINNGEIKASGDTNLIIDRYLDYIRMKNSALTISDRGSLRTGIKICNVELLDRTGRSNSCFNTNDTMIVKIYYKAEGKVKRPTFGVAIYRTDGVYVSAYNTKLDGAVKEDICGEGCIKLTFPRILLLSGSYTLTVAIYDAMAIVPYDFQESACSFQIKSPYMAEGIFFMEHRWERE